LVTWSQPKEHLKQLPTGERRREEVKTLHASKTQRIDDWAQEQERIIDNRLLWPKEQLESFHRAVLLGTKSGRRSICQVASW